MATTEKTMTLAEAARGALDLAERFAPREPESLRTFSDDTIAALRSALAREEEREAAVREMVNALEMTEWTARQTFTLEAFRARAVENGERARSAIKAAKAAGLVKP